LNLSDVRPRLLPVNDFPVLDVPYSHKLIKTPTRNEFVSLFDEELTLRRQAKRFSYIYFEDNCRYYVRVLKYLNRFVEHDVPKGHCAVRASRQQQVRVRLAPINIEDV